MGIFKQVLKFKEKFIGLKNQNKKDFYKITACYCLLIVLHACILILEVKEFII